MRATKDLNERVAQRSRRPALASRLLVAAVAAHHSTGAFGFHAVPPFAAGGRLARAGVGRGCPGLRSARWRLGRRRPWRVRRDDNAGRRRRACS